jgi:phospholipid-binding lipoprotein MlaA
MISKKFRSSLLGTCIVMAVAGILGGCTTPPGEDPKNVVYNEVQDPLEPLNRYFFDVNNALDAVALKPAAHIYRDAVPDGVRDSVSNFLTNISQPIYFINNIAQGDIDGAGDNMGAFFTNTFLGVGGLFDVAQIDTDDEDLGQTMAVWGIPEGPYLVLPVLGPNTTREAAGIVGELFIDPANLVAANNDISNFTLYRAGGNVLDFRSKSLESLDEIEKNSIDFYAAVRSLYRQNRKSAILDGDEALTPLPDISFDLDDDEPKKSDSISFLFEEDDAADLKSQKISN